MSANRYGIFSACAMIQAQTAEILMSVDRVQLVRLHASGTFAVSCSHALANNYKTVTSRYLRKEFEKELRPYYWKPYFWSDSYFICTVSDRTEEMVKRYIENQGKRKYSRG